MTSPRISTFHALRWGFILLLSAICHPVLADTIIGRTGPAQADGRLGPNTAYSVSWSSTQAFSNVSITARMTGENSVLGTGIAYLTTRIGLGTTVLDQVAAAPFIVPIPFASDVLLFSGVSLSAGTYYLTLSSPQETTAWLGAFFIPTTTAPGVTYNGQFGHRNTPVDPYPPASGFAAADTPQGFSSLLFVVAGDPVPEPSIMILVLAGSGLFLCWKRRR